MAGKTRPSLRAKTLQNVALSNLSLTDKQCIQSVFEKFEALSKADVVEVKHGHWMNVGFGEYWCSVCDANGEDVLDKRGNPNWKDCPNCGAKMDERKENND